MAEITSELLEVTVDTDHTVEIDSKLPEVVVDTAKSITVEIQPENYVLTSGGMYTGNMTGATPKWLLNAIEQQLTTGDGNIMSVLDAMQTLLNSVQLGVNQAISQIENTNVSMSALETSLGSRIGSNEAAILDVYATRVTAADAQAIAATAIGTTFGGNVDAYIGNLASVYTSAGSATATNIATLQVSYNDQTARIDTVESITIENSTAIETLETTTGISINELQAQIDGVIDSWYYSYVPDQSNFPWSDWLAIDTLNANTVEQTRHLGDLFYDLTTGTAYRFASSGGVYGWAVVTDTAITLALAEASNAQYTADGKASVYYSSTAPMPKVVNGVTIPIEIGDMWVNSNTKIVKVAIAISPTIVWADFTNTATENALLGIAALEETNDGVVNTFYQAIAPTTGMSYGDWWVETDVTPIKPYRYEDSNGKSVGVLSWVYKNPTTNILANAIVTSDTAKTKVEQVIDGTLAINITNATVDGTAIGTYVANEIDKEVVILSGTAAPTVSPTTPAGKINDIYIQKTTATSTAGIVVDVVNTWKHNGTIWVAIGSNENLTALADLADGKRTIYSNAGIDIPLAGIELNDMWIPSSNSTDNITYIKDEIYIYKITGWVKATKYTDDTKANNIINGLEQIDLSKHINTLGWTDDSSLDTFLAVTYADDISDIQGQIDGKSVSWFQSVEPFNPATGTPAQNGDVWFNSTSKELKVYVYSTLSWNLVTDPKAISAYDLASTAKSTADGKIQNFTAEPTTPYYAGDTWMQGSTGDIYVCNVERLTGLFTQSDWIIASKYTDDTVVNNILNGTTSIANAKIGTVTIGEYVSSAVETGVDNMVHVYSGSETQKPLTAMLGDLYVETHSVTAVVTSYRWDNSAWVEIEGASNVQALQDLTDGKRTIYTTSGIPTNTDAAGDLNIAIRDLWIPPATVTINTVVYRKGEIYICNSISPITFVVATEYYNLIANVQTQVDGKVDTYYQATLPYANQTNVPKDVRGGDYWYCTANVDIYVKGNIYKYVESVNGSNFNYVWTINADITKSAFDAIDGKKTIFGGATVPTAIAINDIWVPSGYVGSTYKNGYMYQWNGSIWDDTVTYTDDTVASAKSQIIYATVAPTTVSHPLLDIGDQWVDTANGLVKVWSGTAWVDVVAKSTAEVLQQLADLEEARDGSVVIYYETSTTIPTGMTYGDYMVDTDSWNGSLYTVYRYENSVGGSIGTLAWYANTGETAKALSSGYRAQVLAGTAKITADGKVKTWYQASAPTLTASDIGDYWIDTDNANKMQVWSGTAWKDPTSAQGTTAYNWSANASKLITGPDGGVTGWSFGNGSNSQSNFKIKAQNFSISDGTTGYTPFSITGSDINFLGKVSFSSVTGAPSGGSNLLYNSAPMLANETKGWSVGWYNTGIVPTLGAGFDSWRPSGGGSVFAGVPGAPTVGTIFNVVQTAKVPVIGGTWYEASAYISSHRCTSYVTIAWYDSNNTYITDAGGSPTAIASGGALSNWSRSTLLAQAPANAARALFYVRSAVSGTDPYCFVAFAYLGQAVQGQVVFSDWSEGTSAGVSSGEVVNDINNGTTTTINGGKITTGSITANQIATNTITTNNIALGTGLVNGYVQSSNFTGIGGAGFRLKSNAAGTSVDPTIYGAYIYGSRLEGSFTNVSSFRVYSTTFINNSGRVYFRDFKYNLTSSVGTHLTSGTFYGEQYGTGYVETRICDSVSSIVEIEVGGSSTDGSSIDIQVSANGGAFLTIFSGQPLSFYRSFIVKYDVPSPYYNTFVFRAYAQTARTAIRHITTTLFNM